MSASNARWWAKRWKACCRHHRTKLPAPNDSAAAGSLAGTARRIAAAEAEIAVLLGSFTDQVLTSLPGVAVTRAGHLYLGPGPVKYPCARPVHRRAAT